MFAPLHPGKAGSLWQEWIRLGRYIFYLKKLPDDASSLLIESEEKRYLEYYQVYVNNASNYDLIVDTTNLTFDQVLTKIIEFLKTFQ